MNMQRLRLGGGEEEKRDGEVGFARSAERTDLCGSDGCTVGREVGMTVVQWVGRWGGRTVRRSVGRPVGRSDLFLNGRIYE